MMRRREKCFPARNRIQTVQPVAHRYTKFFPYNVAEENQSFHNFKSEIDVQVLLNGTDTTLIPHSNNDHINILHHIGGEKRKVWLRKSLCQTINFN
jgi:hypothetical protein